MSTQVPTTTSLFFGTGGASQCGCPASMPVCLNPCAPSVASCSGSSCGGNYNSFGYSNTNNYGNSYSSVLRPPPSFSSSYVPTAAQLPSSYPQILPQQQPASYQQAPQALVPPSIFTSADYVDPQQPSASTPITDNLSSYNENALPDNAGPPSNVEIVTPATYVNVDLQTNPTYGEQYTQAPVQAQPYTPEPYTSQSEAYTAQSESFTPQPEAYTSQTQTYSPEVPQFETSQYTPTETTTQSIPNTQDDSPDYLQPTGLDNPNSFSYDQLSPAKTSKAKARGTKIRTLDPSRCNNEQLKSLMEKQMTESPSIAKRKIQQVANRQFNATFDVICSRSNFSYSVNSQIWCEIHTQDLICFSFLHKFA
ncbi:Ground-like domain-containing protein [Aphelenchoides besseyi]|nr:Ground-like domain-containing protein [Aphelenchoides besseyi]